MIYGRFFKHSLKFLAFFPNMKGFTLLSSVSWLPVFLLTHLCQKDVWLSLCDAQFLRAACTVWSRTVEMNQTPHLPHRIETICGHIFYCVLYLPGLSSCHFTVSKALSSSSEILALCLCLAHQKRKSSRKQRKTSSCLLILDQEAYPFIALFLFVTGYIQCVVKDRETFVS